MNFLVKKLNQLSKREGLKVEKPRERVIKFPEIEYTLTSRTLKNIFDVENDDNLKKLIENKEEIKLKFTGFSDGRFKFKILGDISEKEFYTYYLKKDLGSYDLINFINWFFITGFSQGKNGLLFSLVDLGEEKQSLKYKLVFLC